MSAMTGRGIQSKLLRSHLRVAAVGFVALLVAHTGTQLLRTNAKRLAQERGPAAEASMAALSGVQRSLAELSGWVAFGDSAFRDRRAATWEHQILPAIAGLRAAAHDSPDVDAARVEELAAMLLRLAKVQNDIERLAERPEADRGGDPWEIMAKEAVPLGRQASRYLHGISAGQVALMKVDAASVSILSDLGSLFSVALLIGMGALAVTLSRRSAEAITQPISRLAKATEDLAVGRLRSDVPVSEDDEVGQLTRSFNGMRASLEAQTGRLRETVEQLSEATTRILAETTQQTKGTVEQTAALREISAAVAAVVGAGEPVAQRARGLLGSLETVEQAQAESRRVLEGWLAAAGASSAGASQAGSSLAQKTAEIHDLLAKLSLLVGEAHRVAGEATAALDAQISRLRDVDHRVERIGQLATQHLDRTVRVEQVAQNLKAHNRALNQFLAIYRAYDPRHDGAAGDGGNGDHAGHAD